MSEGFDISQGMRYDLKVAMKRIQEALEADSRHEYVLCIESAQNWINSALES